MKLFAYVCFVCLFMAPAVHAGTRSPEVRNIRFEITQFSKRAGLLHWKIANNSSDGVFVYNFFLLGPAYSVERGPAKLIFDTAPTTRVASCAPNRVAPPLFLFVRSGGVIEGDFVDSEVGESDGKRVSLKIAVGLEPYNVLEETKRFSNSHCKHSPYDAVVNWATILESDSIQMP